jgi:hypothetical protein
MPLSSRVKLSEAKALGPRIEPGSTRAIRAVVLFDHRSQKDQSQPWFSVH